MKDTTINIKVSTKKRLNKIGNFRETYDDLIKRIINDRHRLIQFKNRTIKEGK